MVRPASPSSPDRRALEEAAERRREMMRRRAEEARRRAERAREQARRAQDAARREAHQARDAAREARRAESAVRRTERALRDAERRDPAGGLGGGPGGGPGGDQRAQLEDRLARERLQATRLRDEATRAETRAEDARDQAITSATHALDTQRSANRAFEARGRPAPFELADRVEDVYDAGSLSDGDQEKLFGARAVVSAQDAAEADARKVEMAAEISPENGAAMLRMQMENSPDPKYRRALAEASRPIVEELGDRLANDDRTTSEAARSSVRDLARAGELAGPASAKMLADSFARHLPEELSAPLSAALRDNASSEEGATFGQNIAESLSAEGKYQPANQIARLDGELREAGLDRGEQAARDAITVDDSAVRGERDQLSRDLDSVEERTKNAVDKTFERANGGRLPHGAEVVSRSENSVEIERRDKNGRVLWRESATRDGDQLNWERTDFRDGVADRKTLESGGEEGTTVRRERWKEPAGKNPSDPSTEELKSRSTCDPTVAVYEQSVRRDGESLISSEGSWDEKGRSEVEKTYRIQTGSEGIHSTVAEDFDDDAETTVVETSRVDQPRGKEETSSEEVSYSQGNLRATSQSADDVKQWTLEKQDGNLYRSQTFVEDAPQVSTVTTRRAEGRTIHEEVESQGLDEEGEEIEGSSSAETEFDRRGMIVRKRTELTDEEGVKTTQDFRREEERTERGIEVLERTQTTRTEPGDPPGVYESDRRVRSLNDGRSTRLLSVRETIGGPEGTATSIIDDKGPRLTVNGAPVPISEGSKEFDALRGSERDLAAQAVADAFSEVKKYGSLGSTGLSLVSIGRGAAEGIDSRLSAVTRERLDARLDSFHQRLNSRFGTSRVASAFRVQSAGLAGAKGLGGVAGLAAAAFGLSSNVEQLNFNQAQAALDAGNAVAGGSQSVAAAKEAGALRAGASADDVAAAGGKFATFAKFGGLATGVAAGGFEVVQGIKAGDEVKIAQGGVTIAGAVGAFAVAGAVGGPLGVAAGAAIGLVAFGIHEGIGALFGDDEPEVAEKVI